MARKFMELRHQMLEYEMTQPQMAKLLGRSTDYISRRFRGADSFTFDEAYTICDALRIPYEKIYIYFPPGGAKLLTTCKHPSDLSTCSAEPC